MTIEASETDLSIADVPEDEVFLIEELGSLELGCVMVERNGG